MKTISGLVVALVFLVSAAEAKIDLVSLPGRDAVQLTIYNSADLTLVRETRTLILKKGVNRLQFSWANTLIDPTSLDMRPKQNAGQVDIFDLTYPPRAPNMGLWHIRSKVAGSVPVEITYLTSGLSWRPFYLGTLSSGEQQMALSGFVRVTNRSGEDYAQAQVRLVVGKVHLLDEIAALARRYPPFGTPIDEAARMERRQATARAKAVFEAMDAAAPAGAAVKEITREGLSEYYLYTIEGRETISHQWSKRLPSFTAETVPARNLYRYDEERYGSGVIRFLTFDNKKEAGLGDTPIPAGAIQVFRNVDADAHLAYQGGSQLKYTPVGKDAEVNLGAVENVRIEPTRMGFATERYTFFKNGDISGWDEIRTVRVQITNARSVPAAVEIFRSFPVPRWEIRTEGDAGKFTKYDTDTVTFRLTVPAAAKREFTYTVTLHHGTRGED